MNSIDALIKLAAVFNSDVRLRKDVNDKYLVDIYRVSYKENHNDIQSRSICGRGETLEQACNNFLNEARGRLLFGDDLLFYGKDRPMFICV